MTATHRRVSAYLSFCLHRKMDDPSTPLPVEIFTVLPCHEKPIIIPHPHAGHPSRLHNLFRLGLTFAVVLTSLWATGIQWIEIHHVGMSDIVSFFSSLMCFSDDFSISQNICWAYYFSATRLENQTIAGGPCMVHHTRQGLRKTVFKAFSEVSFFKLAFKDFLTPWGQRNKL